MDVELVFIAATNAGTCGAQTIAAHEGMIRAAGATNAHAATDMRPARLALDRHQGANLSKQLLP